VLRLTKKADYGLMALKYLAEHSDEASLSAKDIAEAYHIYWPRSCNGWRRWASCARTPA
jgi:hypothetical protein